MTITIMTNATTTCSAIKPSISNMSNIIKSVANIQHTIHIISAIAAILITYDKHPLIIVCFSAFKLIICHPKNYSETRTAAFPIIIFIELIGFCLLLRLEFDPDVVLLFSIEPINSYNLDHSIPWGLLPQAHDRYY